MNGVLNVCADNVIPLTPDSVDAVVRIDDVVAILEKFPGVAKSMCDSFDKEMFLKHAKIPLKYTGGSQNTIKSFKKECRGQFEIIADRLYHRSNAEVRQRVEKGASKATTKRRGADNMDEHRLVITSADHFARALWEAHDSPHTGGHDGVDTVMTKMQRTLMLPRGARDVVKEYTRSCLCQSA